MEENKVDNKNETNGFKEFYNRRELNLNDETGKTLYIKRMIEEINKIGE